MHGAQARGIFVFVAVIIAGYLGWALVHSITDIPTYNDFEVFHYVGGLAAEREPIIYETKTPHQQRGPFIYPVSASVLFIPLSWLEHNWAGVLFSIIKIACLLLLWWGGVRFSGTPPRDALGYALTIFGPAVMLHRAVASDVGNGQINIILAAASAGGVWLMMLSRRAWWFGSLLLAWAIAIKMTPALLLAVPVLNRRWRPLTIALISVIVLAFLLPVLWFGWADVSKMNSQYREIAARFTFDWPAPDEQVTATELVQFVRLQTDVARTGEPGDPDVLPVSISGYGVERLFRPEFRSVAFAWWLGIGLATGAAFLVVRATIFARGPDRSQRDATPRRAGDWTWDLAMLCCLIVLLSPRAQKAHLVILIIPAAWLAARVCNWFAPQASARQRRARPWGVAMYVVICAMMFISESLAIPIPGFREPARCMALLGLLTMIAALIAVGRVDRPTRVAADS